MERMFLEMAMQNKQNVKLALSAMLLALGLVLPFLTGQIREIGNMFLPMHLPALLCGFACGWPWGLAVGFIVPLLRSALFGMPMMMPMALCMAFELAAYGAAAGFLYKKMRLLPALLLAMLVGRAVWGLVSWAVYALFMPKGFTLSMFWLGAFANAWPGILLQLVLVPLLVNALKRARVME